MKKILRLKSSKNKKSKERNKIRSEYPESQSIPNDDSNSGENSRISPKDLKYLMDVINLIDRYASKGVYEKAITKCRQVLDGIQNEQDHWFSRAVVMNKLNELEHKVKEIEAAESISNEKKASVGDKTIAFVKRSLEFIQKIKAADSRLDGFEYLEFLCGQEFDLHDQLGDELNKARVLDLQAYLNVEQVNYEEAIELADKAIKIRGLAHVDNKEMLISFGCKSYAYFSMKEYSKAIPFLEVTLKITESNQTIDRHFEAFQLNNLALVYLKSRTVNSDKIDELFARALQIARSIDYSNFKESKIEIMRTLAEKIEYAQQFSPFQTEQDDVVLCGSCHCHCPGCGSKSKPTEFLLREMHLIKCLKCGSLIAYVEEAKIANCSAAKCDALVKIPENYLDFYLTQLDDFY